MKKVFHTMENSFPHCGKLSRLFLFDLDGTLIDSRTDLAAATNRMRALHQLPPLPIDLVTTFVGDGIRTLAVRALDGTTVDPDVAAAEIGQAYDEHLTDTTTVYPGVESGLRALHSAGHVLALVTNKPGPHAKRLFDHFGWTPLFAILLGGGDTPELKPSPLPLKTAMEHTGFSTADTFMVGDHHTDLEAARRAGVRSIFLSSGFGHPGNEKPDLVFADFPAFVAHFLRNT